jgi:hypothetical protein
MKVNMLEIKSKGMGNTLGLMAVSIKANGMMGNSMATGSIQTNQARLKRASGIKERRLDGFNILTHMHTSFQFCDC